MNEVFFAGKVSRANVENAGVFHWLMQRVTAVALIPLPFWMIFFIRHLVYSSHEQIIVWLSAPLNLVFLALSALVTVYHAVLGIQSILDDYVHHQRCKTISMWTVRLGFLLLLIAMLSAVWRIGAMG